MEEIQDAELPVRLSAYALSSLEQSCGCGMSSLRTKELQVSQ